jgi:muramoyltetrapeptide carboxypeptidase
VDGILTFIGGYHANQLLDRLDFHLVAANPKVLCGYSDITALQHALLASAGLATYSGPHWSTFGMREHADDTIAWFRACLFDDAPFEVRSAGFYTDDAWFAQQDGRPTEATDGWWVLQTGETQGGLLPANLGTLSLLKGTPWWPPLAGGILVVEDDELADIDDFARNLQSLLHQPGADGVRGLAIGRFQQASGVTREHLEALVARLPQLAGLPVIANIDYGHTNPLCTLPVGGTGRLVADPADPRLVVVEH